MKTFPAALIPLSLLLLACRPGADEPLGPAESYLLFGPASGEAAPGGGLLVERRDGSEVEVAPLVRVLSDGFGAEMLRTIYLAKQYVRGAQPGGQPFSPAARQRASDPVPIVIGADRAAGPGTGLRVQGRWLGEPLDRPGARWLGFPRGLGEDAALVQTATARMAFYLAQLAASGGELEGPGAPSPSPVLVTGYQRAMEVIAREWHAGDGALGRLHPHAGTEAQRTLFANVRENFFVRGARGAVREGGELLRDPGVAATVIYRWGQDRKLAGRVAPDEFYRPFVAAQKIPAGISPAAVLGSFRNWQAKLLGAWMSAAKIGHPPRDIVDLLEVYGAAFPAEKAEAIRIFLVTTFGATVKAGGVSLRPEDARIALAELTALTAEVVAGRRGLRAALTAPATAPQTPPPAAIR